MARVQKPAEGTAASVKQDGPESPPRPTKATGAKAKSQAAGHRDDPAGPTSGVPGAAPTVATHGTDADESVASVAEVATDPASNGAERAAAVPTPAGAPADAEVDRAEVTGGALTGAGVSEVGVSEAGVSEAGVTEAGTGVTGADVATPPAKAATKGSKGHARARTDGRKPAGPAQDRSVPADRFLAEQQELLLTERASHVRQADSLKEEADALAAEMEPGESEFGEEGGEGGNLSVERELDLVLSAQAKAAVEEIDRALVKIEAGTYGMCEKCGKEIPKARLKVLPHAPMCVACKSGGLSRR